MLRVLGDPGGAPGPESMGVGGKRDLARKSERVAFKIRLKKKL